MRFLFIGAHPDDIFLHCGGTIARLKFEQHSIWCVFCSNGELGGKKRQSEEIKAYEFMGVNGVGFGLEDGHLDESLIELINLLENEVDDYRPDVVFAHCENDHHQDHRAVAKAIRSVARKRSFSLVSYLSYDNMAISEANLFVNITNQLEKKKELLKIYRSQSDKWYMKKYSHSGMPFASHVEKFKVECLLV